MIQNRKIDIFFGYIDKKSEMGYKYSAYFYEFR